MHCPEYPWHGPMNCLPSTTTPELVSLLAGQRLAVLTGAGLSTDSGIPDYRGPDSPPSNPMTIRQFTSDPAFRQRYWARNHVGWRHMDDTLPNAGHRALAALERAGVVTGVITQNVDLLHTKAGSRNVVNLHGTYARVVCLSCGSTMTRSRPGRPARSAQPRLHRARRTRRRHRRGARRRRDGERHLVVPVRRLSRVAAACSSPTSSTSARAFRKTGWRRRIRWSTTPTPCWSPARR